MVIGARSALPASLLAVLAMLALALGGCATSDSSSTGASATATPTQTEAPDVTPTAEPSATADPTSSDEPAGEAEVVITGARFVPAELTVAAGTEVAFVNEDGYGHTVTEGTDGQAAEDAFVDEELPANDTVRVVFDEPGTFDITCIIHPTMQMTITVED